MLRRVQQLVGEGELLEAAQLLNRERTNASQTEAATFESIRMLCVSGAEQVRLSRELATAARDHQRAADQVRDRIQELLEAHPALGSAGSMGAKAAQPHGPLRRLLTSVRSQGEPVGVAGVGEDTRPAASARGQLPEAVAPEHTKPSADVMVAVLGPLEVTVHGKRVTGWGGQRNRNLLQYLVLHMKRPVHREVLMEVLWPGYSYTSARNNLNVCLYGLRQALQAGTREGRFVLYNDGRYLFDPELTWQVDRTEFVSLIARARSEAQVGQTRHAIELYEGAVRLWRGPLFEDDPPCEWFAAEQRSLQELYLQALEELADLYLAGHDFRAASDTAQRVLEEDACRESAHRVLMRCYSRQHQQSLIARQFQLCVSALRREFSLSPTDETVQLFRALTATQAV